MNENEDTPEPRDEIPMNEETPEPRDETPAGQKGLRKGIAGLREAEAVLDRQIAEALELMRRGAPPVDLEEKYLQRAKFRQTQAEWEARLAGKDPPEPA
jgi:hypothetical protein